MNTGIPFPDISPVLIEIPLGFTTLPIRWYALAYIVGIILGYRLARRMVANAKLWKNDNPPMNGEHLEEFLTWLILGILIGGRVGYVIGYGEGQFLQDPLSIFRLWEGGMAFHGGFLGVGLAAILFCIKHKLPLIGVLDVLALGTPPGIFLGRIANFINAELWGRPTEMPWGVIFPGSAAQNCPDVVGLCARHPSQLYEAALEGLVLGLVMLWLAYRRDWLKRPGMITGLFIGGYGIARFFVEFYRLADAQFITPDNPLGHVVRLGEFGITRGQQLSLPMVVAGLGLLIYAARRRT